MDRFAVSKRPMLTVTTHHKCDALLVRTLCKGENKATDFNKAQKAVSSLQKIAPLSQQRTLAVGADRGKADWCRSLPLSLHALQGAVHAKYFVVLLRNTNLLQQAYVNGVHEKSLAEQPHALPRPASSSTKVATSAATASTTFTANGSTPTEPSKEH